MTYRQWLLNMIIYTYIGPDSTIEDILNYFDMTGESGQKIFITEASIREWLKLKKTHFFDETTKRGQYQNNLWKNAKILKIEIKGTILE